MSEENVPKPRYRVLMHQVDSANPVPVKIQEAANACLSLLGIEVLGREEGQEHMAKLARTTWDFLRSKDPKVLEGFAPPKAEWSVLLVQAEQDNPIPMLVQSAIQMALAALSVKVLSVAEGAAVMQAVVLEYTKRAAKTMMSAPNGN